MKKLALSLGLAALVVLAPLVARGEDAKLPFNPFEKAQKGDWSFLRGTFKRDGAGETKTPATSFARVVKVENDQVTVSEQVQVGAIEKATKVFSTKEAPTVAAYFDLKDGKVEGVKVEDDKRTVGEKELACKKVSFIWKHGTSEDAVTAWLSPEIKSGGLAAFTMKGRLKGDVELETHIKLECGGSGTGDKADMGESPDDLLDPELLGAPDEALELPFQPFASSKKGDWAVIKVDADMGGRSEVATINFEVTKTGKESIQVEATSQRGGRGGANDSNILKFERDKRMSALEFVSMLVKGRSPGDRPKPAVMGVKIVDDKKTVGEREFACKRISFSFKEHSTTIKVRMWVSEEVKGLGLVAAEIRAREKSGNVSFDIEIAGFGDEDKAEWGKTAEQLAKKKKKPAEDE